MAQQLRKAAGEDSIVRVAPQDGAAKADLIPLILNHLDPHRGTRMRIRRAFVQTVQAINAVAARHDHYTAHHHERVAILALALGRRLQLASDRLESVYLGALVHDVGKVAIPTELLNKPDRLTIEEFTLVKTHVRIGCEILQPLTLPWPIQAIVAQHHERLDGSGYPQGLRAEAILPESRIVAVADVFQALCDDRPYRVALGIQAALAELERGAGRAFDADAVAALRTLTKTRGQSVTDFWAQLTSDIRLFAHRPAVSRPGRLGR